MTLQNKLQDDLITARKSKNQAEIEAIGFILAQIRYDQIDKQREPTEEEVLKLIEKEVKKTNEAIQLYQKAGRNDLINSESKKLEIMKKYLPQQADEETIKKELLTIVNHEKDKNFGSLMKKALAEFQGRASGAQIAKILREVLG